MKKWLRAYFDLSKREMNGFFALLVVLISVSIFPYLFEWYWHRRAAISANDQLAIQQLTLVDRYQKYHPTLAAREEIEYGSRKETKSYFKFDPNTTTLENWQKLGFSTKQANVLLNYVKKGGRFYKPEDLQRMFVVSEQKFIELQPYIAIEKVERTNTSTTAYSKKEPQVIEINAADTLQLDKIKGIGAAFARRIVKYRDRLGGFHQKEQLMEVYGLDSIKFKEISHQIYLDPTLIKRININQVTFDDLKNYPYLKYKEMNAIVQYRKQHGNYRNVDDLRKILILSSQTIDRIAPYLNFEP